MYAGQIATIVRKSSQLKSALQEYEAIAERIATLGIYAYLVFAADSSTPAHGAFLQAMRKHTVELSNQLIFFELELGRIPDEAFSKLLADPVLKTYRHYLENQRRFKPHRLGESEEQIMQSKSITGRGAFVRLFDQQFSAQRYSLKKGRTEQRMSQSEILDRLLQPQQQTRKQAAQAFSAGLQELLPQTTYITNVLSEDGAIEAKYRRYSSPETERHLENEIDPAVVELMSEVVTKSYPLAQRYYRLKGKALGLRKMYDYDRAAPLARTRTKVAFPEGQKIVLNAFSRFSPEYAAAAKDFFDHGWIDARLRPGKQGGAFCMYVTPQLHPYILLNYTGSMESVMTLAHELGHGVHGMLAHTQPYLNFNWPITVAEVASIFGEMLVFDALQEKLNSPTERFNLYMGLLDRIMSTVFRQMAMYRFEQAVHEERAQGELSSERLNALWRTAQKALYGSSLTLTPEYDRWWSYIPHFIHSPFYVYAYAFGELLTLSLFALYRQQGSALTEKYITVLRSGGSQSPPEVLAPLGIDLTQASFWKNGIREIDGFLAEAEALYTA